MLKKLINLIIGDQNEKEINRLRKIVAKINELESKVSEWSHEDFIKKTNEFKALLQGKKTTFEEILPLAFAMVKEAAYRTLGQKHRDVQLIGGIVLHEGKIAELKTGEGKTLMATAPLYLNALMGKGAYLVTVNDYLAKRDSQWMSKVYNYLGLTVGCITHEKTPAERKEAYNCDVTYGTNNEFGFDYLRDNMATDPENVVQRKEMFFAVVDEVDSILIDEARTPLIISAPNEESTDKYVQYSRIAKSLIKDEDFTVDEKHRNVILTQKGISKIERILGVDNIYTAGKFLELHHLEQALKAHMVFKKDVDYVVQNNEVIIVDEFTGRLMPGRRYSDGLHQAIEAKEGVPIQRESKTLATISFQNYFRLFEKLAGMTGTAFTEAEEFSKIYGLDVVVVPTHLPVKRIDLPDKIYKNTISKFKAIVEDIKEKYQKGQPVLVGTISVEKSEILSEMLKKEGIPHKVLNAKYHKLEAEIIAQAGRKHAVTISTNMAGRGTDILLGGNPEMIAKQMYEQKNADNENAKSWYELSLEEQMPLINEAKKITEKEKEEVLALGGLYVIGTERHESRRIDNQLRGRSGRQGDVGLSQFYVSLDDNLMRYFGSERIQKLMQTLNFPDDMPIQNSFISSSIESAQKRVEGRNFDIRKHLVEYDDVMAKHREIIYKKRRLILYDNIDMLSELKNSIYKVIEGIVNKHTIARSIDQWDLNAIINEINDIHIFSENILSVDILSRKFTQIDQIIQYLNDLLYSALMSRLSNYQENTELDLLDKKTSLYKTIKNIYLQTIDTLFVEHIDDMQNLRESVAFYGMAQKDPLVMYKNEAYDKFLQLVYNINFNVVNTVFKADLSYVIQIQNIAEKGITNESEIEKNLTTSLDTNEKTSFNHKITLKDGRVVYKIIDDNISKNQVKISRNDLCPCGSGKKYKKCCGKNI